MRIKLLVIATLFAALSAPALAADDKREQAKHHVDFGISVARNNLWRAATEHWEKATKIDPTYAAAWNNLGIGLEQLGRFKEAREAYEEAMRLDPGNTFIQNNYGQFREIYDRQNRRRER